MTREMTEEKALMKLSALCSQAEHCSQEMIDKMTKWELPDDVQARIMALLIKEKYVDDERFARSFVNDKIRYNKWGRRKVEQALWLKHIPKDISERVLGEVDQQQYVEMLRPMMEQKRKSVTGKSDYEINMKLTKWAMGRGFDFNIIKQCIDGDVDDADF